MQKKNIISCPYHRWGYALNGDLKGTPLWGTYEDEVPENVKQTFSTNHLRNFDKKDYGLIPVRVDSWAGMIFVNLSGNALSLQEYFGDLVGQLSEYPMDELKIVRSATIKTNTNWKILVENFLEYYHLPAVHPELCQVSTVDNHLKRQGKGAYMGFCTFPLTNGNTPIDPIVFPPFPGISKDASETAFFVVQFPNMFYSVYPHHIFAVRVEPVSFNESIEHATFLVHPSLYDTPNAEEKIEKAYNFHSQVNQQDLAICQEVQNGMRVRKYSGGRFAFVMENSSHRFEKMLTSTLTGSSPILEAEK